MATSSKYFSLAILMSLWAAFIPSGCKEKIKKDIPIPKEGVAKIVAVYTKPDGSKVLEVMLRQITKSIKYDSVLKKDVVVVDTLFGFPIPVPLVDSVGKEKKDSLGHLVYRPNPAYIQIGKDSVIWQISGIPTDSLLKK